VAGFSLHAAQAVAAEDRRGLERLCRYGLRPAFAQDRLSVREDGRVLYHLRRPWPHSQGATCLVLEPLDFLRRLAALIPAPYAHMVRYHGCFANHARARALLPAPPPSPVPPAQAQTTPAAVPGAAGNSAASADQSADSPPPARRTSLSWAQLLHRVFFIEALRCPRCAATMVILAFLSDPPVVARILRHLRLPTAPPPLAPARGGGGSGAWGCSAPLPLSPDDPAAQVPEHTQTCVPPHEGLQRAPARADIRPPP
jgi:hypothetical protein